MDFVIVMGGIFSELFWLELALIASCIVAVATSMQALGVGSPRAIGDDGLTESFKAVIEKFEPDFLAAGFQDVGTYDVSESSQRIVIRMYISSDKRHEAALAEVINEHVKPNHLIELLTHLKPHGILHTNTTKTFNPFAMPKDQLVFKMPWIKTGRDLVEAHMQLIEAAKTFGYEPHHQVPGSPVDRLERGMRRDYENQVSAGRLRRLSDGRYRFTLLGAMISVPKIVYQMLHPYIVKHHRVSMETQIKRLEKRLRAANEMMPEDWSTL